MAQLAITGRKASATVFASNLVVADKQVLYMTVYGPSQEIRAFAQLLMDDGSRVELVQDGEVAHEPALQNIKASNVRLVPHIGNGYSGAFIVPTEDACLLIGDSREECYKIFTRILDQQRFVHRDWYVLMFQEVVREILPLVGSKSCWRYHPKAIETVIKSHLAAGTIIMPPATAQLTIEVPKNNDKK